LLILGREGDANFMRLLKVREIPKATADEIPMDEFNPGVPLAVMFGSLPENRHTLYILSRGPDRVVELGRGEFVYHPDSNPDRGDLFVKFEIVADKVVVKDCDGNEIAQ